MTNDCHAIACYSFVQTSICTYLQMFWALNSYVIVQFQSFDCFFHLTYCYWFSDYCCIVSFCNTFQPDWQCFLSSLWIYTPLPVVYEILFLPYIGFCTIGFHDVVMILFVQLFVHSSSNLPANRHASICNDHFLHCSFETGLFFVGKQYNLTEDASCRFCSDMMEGSILDYYQHILGECIITRELNDQLWVNLKEFWDKSKIQTENILPWFSTSEFYREC
ncbi:hypothetical protein PROFUN_07069 [Planoprotostelium fungivorum]|uniref:Uncharacterized protein n=1 Tax=Planoprotostelium fungivorum TaxID=1890364 RepID=A0A2P6NN26_9EUKA|nr:hypothetical protein PROFUN_07069 [Planoprotostelium fungivorum]